MILVKIDKLKQRVLYQGEEREVGLSELMYKYFVTSLGIHGQTEKIIHELFEQNEDAQECFLKNDDLHLQKYFDTFPIRESLAIKKADALFQTKNEETQGMLFKLFERSYNRFLRFREVKDFLDVDDLITKISNDLEGNVIIPAFIFYELYGAGKILNTENFRNLVMDACESISSFEVDYGGNLPPLNKEEEIEALEKFNKLTGEKLKKETTIDKILSSIDTNTIKILKNKYRFGISEEDINKHENVIHFKRLSAIVYNEGINEIYFFSKVNFGKEEYLKFYRFFLIRIKAGRIEKTDDAFRNFFAEYLIVVGLLRMYKESNVLTNEIILNEIELKKQRFELQEKKKEVLRKENQINAEFSSKEKAWEEEKSNYQKRIEELEKQLKQKNEVEDEFNELKKEVVELREFVFDSMSDLKVSEDMDTIPVKPVEKRGVYFGGHPNLVKKLKKALPNTRFVSPEELSIDLNFVHGADFICFDTTYNNHASYYRLKDLKVKNNVIYLNDKNSVQSILGVIERNI